MAIAPTGAIYKSLRFDGIDSRDYGVYISGDGVFNAPERDVEMIEIPGRNGAFALDNGRFRNIEVTYPGGMFADSEEDFAAGISAFRNYLCSRKGYCRLEDDYHPGEYRMAVYKGGLEVTPAQLKAGEFNIVFDCKPQRWLTSGEEPIDVDEPLNPQTASGSIVTFDADEDTVISSLKVSIAPKQAGSGDPSPTNVRPISGWTDADVRVNSMNLFPNTLGVQSVTKNGVTFDITEENGFITDIYMHGTATGSGSLLFANADNGFQLPKGILKMYLAGDKTTSGSRFDLNVRRVGSTQDIVATTAVVTISNEEVSDFGSAYIYFYTGAVLNHHIMPCIVPNDVDTSAYPKYPIHNGTTTPVPLGKTVYGGECEVITGASADGMHFVSLTGNEAWNDTGAGYIVEGSAYPYAINQGTSAGICSHFIFGAGNLGGDGIFAGISASTGKYFLFAKSKMQTLVGVTSLAEWKTFLQTQNANGTPVQVAYWLKDSVPFTTTPIEVRTLLGTNNVWSVGDVEVTWAESQETLTNPTLFDAKPLLQVWGYGDININDEQIHIEDKPIGYIAIANSEKVDGRFVSGNYVATKHYTFNGGLLNQGDSITLQGAGFQFDPYLISGTSYKSITSVTATVADAESEYYQVNEASISTINPLHVTIRVGPRIITSGQGAAMAARYDLEYGTAFSHTSTVNVTLALVNNNDEDVEWSFAITAKVEYDGAEGIDVTVTAPGSNASFNRTLFMTAPQASAISTKGALGEPLYFDMDLGEAYKEEAGEIISVNSAVTFPAELPVLVPGINTITHTGHIRQLKVVPRWWEV